MPSMYEIYQRHSAEYDELVNAEDYEGNLRACLLRIAAWRGKRVLEAGVGTGRVTQLYADLAGSVVCMDQSLHMIEAARRRLAAFGNRISFRQGDNLSLPAISPPFDLFVEGWSFGHAVVDSAEPVERVTGGLIDSATRNLAGSGTVILIETMGTNTAGPQAPHPRLEQFYQLLLEEHSFRFETIRTDYRFPSAEEAARIMGFFFGDEMRQALEKSRLTVVPEWTGIWYRRTGPAGGRS